MISIGNLKSRSIISLFHIGQLHWSPALHSFLTCFPFISHCYLNFDNYANWTEVVHSKFKACGLARSPMVWREVYQMFEKCLDEENLLYFLADNWRLHKLHHICLKCIDLLSCSNKILSCSRGVRIQTYKWMPIQCLQT